MSKILTAGDQERLGVHRMTGGMLDPSLVTRTDNNIRQYEESLTLLKQQTSSLSTIDYSKKELKPTGYTIIVKPYDTNPYLSEIITHDSGLITAPEIGLNGVIKSEDSGEYEALSKIPCGIIIATGPECKYCEVGDDVYYRPGAVPVPFNKKGYYAVSEQNIICRIVNT